MENSFSKALVKAMAPALQEQFRARVTPLDIKLHVERIYLAELVRAAQASPASTDAQKSAVTSNVP